MKIKDFKNHAIIRSNPPYYSNYSSYKPFLEEDFSKRCAYCNLSRDAITTPFEIDHFIPRNAFKTIRPDLETDYKNLIYSCKKCNIAKSNKFKGDLTSKEPTNELFYDPVLVDYNTVFYRNELGAIDSDDPKGKEMIKLLKLYRPIHILAWICDEMNQTAEKLEKVIDSTTDDKKKNEYIHALNLINRQYRKLFNTT